MSTLEVALLLGSVSGSILIVGGTIARMSINEQKRAHKSEMDSVYATLRAAERRITELETQVATLMQLVRHNGIAISAGGNVDMGEFVGHDKQGGGPVQPHEKTRPLHFRSDRRE